ncbi:EF-P lysine aminoacylase GenX [Chromatium okenii]|uniref:EF-P lysine aminoacylase EpmA n=1 Tax=Chromatium okenii TaxID=61644 RepID=UPI001902C8CE|nr:EF-P lysine aminoacylase EpmA [Chromatium okenii]MBK1641766.1 EF-P lysine aminoacylase GenX [Chromatium okenii]
MTISAATDWQPSATLVRLRARAALLARLRQFFAERDVWEVETPLLSAAAVTDPALASFTVHRASGGHCGYLHTSPEFPMKRLLAAGSGAIYQICKVFRDDERGRRHHPEFSLLEWYRPGWDYRQLMDEVAAVVRLALEQPALTVEKISYRELFWERLALDPWTASVDQMRAIAQTAGVATAQLELDHDGWLDLLLTHCLETDLGRNGMTFICDYPPSQAALARIRPDAVPVAERFELYLQGIELANGFTELGDAGEQRARFEADLAERHAQQLPLPPVDAHFLAALAAGLPNCAGVALGLDRLLMLATSATDIDAVLAFPIERA